MKERSAAVIISVAILCVWGAQSVWNLPSAFIARDHGDFTRTAQVGTIVGAIGSVLLWFALARAQWRSAGKWGRRIGALSLVVLGIQSFLTYLAVSRGRISIDADLTISFSTSVIMAVALSVCGFISYAQNRKTA